MFLIHIFCVVLSLSAVYGKLAFVSILFRHGDRTPIHFYQNDPYKNASYWSTGPGQLTNTGKLQHFALGHWFGERYREFIGDQYSKESVYVMSTDVDRTLMSAESNLAGFFPPSGKQVWDPEIKWQPIPIHTMPEKMDRVLSAKKPCPAYDLAKKKYMASPEIKHFLAKYSPLFDYVSQNAGQEVKTITDMEFLYDNLFIEQLNNLTLPDWAKPIYPEPMRTIAAFSFSIAAKTQAMKRLKGGPLLEDIVKHMVAKSKQKLKKKKLWIYSAHDTTVANLLNTLDVLDLHCPPYAAAIMVELHEREKEYYVNIVYKNSTTVPPYNLSLPGCDFDCPLDRFLSLTDPVTISDAQWETECQEHHFLTMLSTGDVGDVIGDMMLSLVTIVVGVILGLLLLGLVYLLAKHFRQPTTHMYERI